MEKKQVRASGLLQSSKSVYTSSDVGPIGGITLPFQNVDVWQIDSLPTNGFITYSITDMTQFYGRRIAINKLRDTTGLSSMSLRLPGGGSNFSYNNGNVYTFPVTKQSIELIFGDGPTVALYVSGSPTTSTPINFQQSDLLIGNNTISTIANDTESAIVAISNSPNPVISLSAAGTGTVSVNTPNLKAISIPNLTTTNVLYYNTITNAISYGLATASSLSGFFLTLTTAFNLGTGATNLSVGGSTFAANDLHCYNTGIFEPVTGTIRPTVTAVYEVIFSPTVSTVNLNGYKDIGAMLSQTSAPAATIATKNCTGYALGSLYVHNPTLTITCTLHAGDIYSLILLVGSVSGSQGNSSFSNLSRSYICCRQLP